MMQLIVYVTFAVLPIVTLLYFQIKFLPFHEVWITYWHRFAVILGFAMLILLTPIMQHAPPKRKWDIRLGRRRKPGRLRAGRLRSCFCFCRSSSASAG
jgi:hypothetical protein